MQDIRIALSSDSRGYHVNATLIASILRRTKQPVHIRCWCRGFLPQSFERGRLRVEFLPATGEVIGKFPGYVGSAVFDRLRVILEATDWDRCLIMDYDQVAFCDLAPLFTMDLGDRLLAAKMQGPGIDLAYAMREWLKRPIPEGWEHAAPNPYFSMGPLMNLAEMRKAGTWEKLLAVQEAFQADENLALVAATEGRTMNFDRKWNLFAPRDVEHLQIPEGVVHWLGWPKPWHAWAKTVWRPELWEAEKCSWEHLRMGLWEKPLTVEVEPDDDHGVEDLLKRGWKVRLFTGREGAAAEELPGFLYPDLELRAAEGSGKEMETAEGFPERLERVRFGSWVKASEWLGECKNLPQHVILRGPVPTEELRRVAQLGYGEACRIRYCNWPAGGPMPRVLDFSPWEEFKDVDGTEELYLKWTGIARVAQGIPADGTSGTSEAATALAVSPGSRKVAVLVAGPGQYRRQLRFFLESLRQNFLPGVEKRTFLFTDGETVPSEDITVIPVVPGPRLGRVNLERYRWILDAEKEFAGYEVLFLLKPQLRVIRRIEADEIFADGLVACLHSSHESTPRPKIRFEPNEESMSWVRPGDGKSYFCGSVQGGGKEAFFRALQTMDDWIAQDEANDVQPVWGDESYWNRYLIDRPPERTLGAEYAWRVAARLPQNGSPKIHILRENTTKEARKERRPAVFPARSTITPRGRRIEPVVSGLWIGGDLPPLAELCIRSYLDHGFEFRLYAYEEIRNAPPGCRLLKAAEILDAGMIYRHHTGSYAPFSDWFRFRLLHEQGGIWTDLDVVALKPFEITRSAWIAMEAEGIVGTGFLAFQAGQEIPGCFARLCEDPASEMPWDTLEAGERKRRLRGERSNPMERRINSIWGDTGPGEFTKAVRHFGLEKSAVPPSRFFPIHYAEWRSAFDGTIQQDSPRLARSWAVHLWGEMLRREPDALTRLSPRSLVSQLMVRHGMGDLVAASAG